MIVLVVLYMCGYFVFFFKQKTAYEMRISDWSSDVCSSDLISLLGAMAILGATTATGLMAHGNVTPQAVDTSALPDIGEEWLAKNPYSGNAKAIEIGQSDRKSVV